MEVSVSPVRLMFSLEVISDVAVASNWLFLTVSPLAVVRINLDSPSDVADLHIPKKHAASVGELRLLFSDASGRQLLAITSRYEYFYFSDQQQRKEFKHLGKLRGIPAMTASFHPSKRGLLLLGTKQGTIVEVVVDSSANETYFKRELKRVSTIWKASSRTQVASLAIGQNSRDLVAAIGSDIVRWSAASSAQNGSTKSSSGVVDLDDGFKSMLELSPKILIEGSETVVKMAVSPDFKVYAAIFGSGKVGYLRRGQAGWKFHDVADVKHIVVSNYHLIVVSSDGDDSFVSIINLLSDSMVETLLVPGSKPIIGAHADPVHGTYWVFSSDTLFEVKLENEMAGMWKVLTDQHRFEEALEVADSRGAKSYVLEKYGHYELDKDAARGAKLLGQSDAPFEAAALDVMRADERALRHLFAARLSHTKSKAQQIILTSWLVELGDYSPLGSEGRYELDPETVKQVLRERGDFEEYVRVSVKSGDIDAAVSFYVANEKWSDALDLIRQHEDANIVYRYASVLLTKNPRQTVESWMRMSKLDPAPLLPSLVSYANEYRGPMNENQALRYLRHLISHGNSTVSLFNATVTILGSHEDDSDALLGFLRSYASKFSSDLDFALRVCLRDKQYKSAVYLYSLMGLYEDAVMVCLEVGGSEMYEMALDIADKQVNANEELRKYLLREIAKAVIKTQGAEAALRFVKLLRVDDLLSQFPDFEMLSELAPEIVKSLEVTNNRLSAVNAEIDESLAASEEMQQEIANFRKRSVLVEPGEPCQICDYPLATRKFLVFPCQHGFHGDCLQKKLKADHPRRPIDSDAELAKECVLCSNDNLRQIDMPLEEVF